MSQKLQSLKKKINKVETLYGVVKMMKNLSASRIIPAQNAVRSMIDYDQMIKLGFRTCVGHSDTFKTRVQNLKNLPKDTGVIIFGSDRGMVGQFNEIITEYAVDQIQNFPGKKFVWGVGGKVNENLRSIFPNVFPPIQLPNRVEGITSFIDDLVTSVEEVRERERLGHIYVLYNKLVSETKFEPTAEMILPLNFEKHPYVKETEWETSQVPDIIGGSINTFVHLLREYIFVTFYKVCAESMASENASRLAMMQEAEKNIDKLLDRLRATYFQERQKSIDEELFDILASFEASQE